MFIFKKEKKKRIRKHLAYVSIHLVLRTPIFVPKENSVRKIEILLLFYILFISQILGMC